MESSEKIDITPIPLAERETYLENFLKNGTRLVKDERYKEAIKYLRNGIVASTLGFNFDDDTRVFFIRKTPDEEGIASIAASIAFNSIFTRGPNKTGTIKIAEISVVGPAITRKPAPFIPPSMWHEVALIHLEEWLHALQYIKGSPLAGESDLEKDVGKYLIQKGIPLARNFSILHS